MSDPQHDLSDEINNMSEDNITSNEKNDRKLFVGGLGSQTTSRSLSSYFSKFGEIEETTVVVDRMTGRTRGFGFIVFRDESSVVKCLQKIRHMIDDVSCEVRRAVTKELLNQNSMNQNRNKIFLSGLPESLDENDIKRYFETFGEVESVNFKIDRATGKKKGFAYITFVYATSAANSVGNHPELGSLVEAKLDNSTTMNPRKVFNRRVMRPPPLVPYVKPFRYHHNTDFYQKRDGQMDPLPYGGPRDHYNVPNYNDRKPPYDYYNHSAPGPQYSMSYNRANSRSYDNYLRKKYFPSSQRSGVPMEYYPDSYRMPYTHDVSYGPRYRNKYEERDEQNRMNQDIGNPRCVRPKRFNHY